VGIREGPDSTLAFALWHALLTGGAYAFVSGVIVMPVSQAMLLVVAGAACGLAAGPLPNAGEPAVPAKRKGTTVLRLVALGLALAASAYTLTVIHRHTDQWAGVERAFAERGAGLHPRFWLQGRLDFRPWSNHLPQSNDNH
jgi:hypothetical protein